MTVRIALLAALAACGSSAAAQGPSVSNIAIVPAEPVLDRYLATADRAQLARDAESGDPTASYLLFVALERGVHSAPEAERWLARLASTNTPAARYAYALARYRADTRAQTKGVEVIDTASPLTPVERQRQVATLGAIAPQFPKAYALLARIYGDGIWLPRDPARVAAFLDKGAAAGAASAMLAAAQAKIGAPGGAADAARLADAASAAGEPGGWLVGCASRFALAGGPETLRDCIAAADQGAAWAQLAAGEMFAREGKNDEAQRYLIRATESSEPAIADRAAMRLAALLANAGSTVQAIAVLGRAADRDALAAWSLGRLYLDQQGDAAASVRWLAKALTLPGAELPAITFDLARATRARGGNWLLALHKAADAGHAQASLALAFELQGRSDAEARRYAEQAEKDPAFAERARQLIDYLAVSPG